MTRDNNLVDKDFSATATQQVEQPILEKKFNARIQCCRQYAKPHEIPLTFFDMAQGLLKKSKPSTAATKRYVWAGSGYPSCDFGGYSFGEFSLEWRGRRREAEEGK